MQIYWQIPNKGVAELNIHRRDVARALPTELTPSPEGDLRDYCQSVARDDAALSGLERALSPAGVIKRVGNADTYLSARLAW